MNIQPREFQLCLALYLIAGALPATGQQGGPDTIDSIKPGARHTAKKQPAKKAPRSGRRSTSTKKKAVARRAPVSSPHPAASHYPTPAAPLKTPALPIMAHSQGMDRQVQQGANQLDATPDELHIDQIGAGDTTAYAAATTSVKLGATPLWKVACSVQFGEPRSMAGGAILRARGGRLGVVMADSVSESMSVYVEGSTARFAQRTDRLWHRFEFIGSRAGTTVWMDGGKIGEGLATALPDSLLVGPMGTSPGRQTEIRVRGLTTTPNPSDSALVDLFNGTDLSGWIHGGKPWRCVDGLIVNTGRDWLAFDPQIPTNGFELAIRVRIIDGQRLRIHLGQDFYVGNEGDSHRLAIIGEIADERQLGDDSYVTGHWYDLRIQVDSQDNVVLSQDGKITHVVRRRTRKPFRLSISPGDTFSQGHIEVATVRLLCLQ